MLACYCACCTGSQAAIYLGIIFLNTKYLCNDLLAKVFVDQASAG